MSQPVQHLAIVGAGMIGASWAALASAHGLTSAPLTRMRRRASASSAMSSGRGPS